VINELLFGCCVDDVDDDDVEKICIVLFGNLRFQHMSLWMLLSRVCCVVGLLISIFFGTVVDVSLGKYGFVLCG
jgi:hypothetical protein